MTAHEWCIFAAGTLLGTELTLLGAFYYYETRLTKQCNAALKAVKKGK